MNKYGENVETKYSEPESNDAICDMSDRMKDQLGIKTSLQLAGELLLKYMVKNKWSKERIKKYSKRHGFVCINNNPETNGYKGIRLEPAPSKERIKFLPYAFDFGPPIDEVKIPRVVSKEPYSIKDTEF